MSSDETLADFLRVKRNKFKQTQREAADEIGVTRQTWVSWERGAHPELENLVKIAEWAMVSLNKLRPYIEGAA